MAPKPIADTWVIARKELSVHLKTRRLIAIGAVFFAVVAVISVYGGYLTGQSQQKPTYEKGAAQVVIIVLSFASFFPGIMAFALTYDAIVGERVNYSMYLLVSKPVRRESIYVGKFLGAWVAIAGVYVAVFSAGLLLIVGLSGSWPSLADVGNVYLAVALILLGVAAWIAFVMLISTGFKTTTSALIVSVLMWLFVLRLVEESGIIYQAATAPEPDYAVSVNVAYSPFAQGMTLVTFSGFKMQQDIKGFDVNLWDSGGNPVSNKIQGSAGAQVSVLLTPGEYAWSANGGANNSATIYANGSLMVLPDVRMSTSIMPMDSDYYYNDFLFSMTDLYSQPLPGGDYALSTNGNVDDSGTSLASIVSVKNITAGWHDFSFVSNGSAVFAGKVFSYGKNSPGSMLLNALTQTEGAPGYVKLTYALDPDDAINGYNYLLDSNYKGYLTLNESVASLAVFLAAFGIAGLLLFKKKDLV